MAYCLLEELKAHILLSSQKITPSFEKLILDKHRRYIGNFACNIEVIQTYNN